MKLYLQDKNASELDLTGLNPNWLISPMSIDLKQQIVERYKQYGSSVISDNYFGSRKVTLSFNLAQKAVTSVANTDSLYTTKLNEIAYFIRNTQAPFYIIDKANALSHRRLKVSIGGLTESFSPGLEKRFGQYQINMVSIDALWEGAEVTVTNASYATQFYTDVTLDTYSYPSYFKIQLTSDSADQTIIQETYSQRYLTINTNSFPAGSTIYVDSRTTGELNISGSSYNQFIINGGFFQLNSGSNRIRIYKNYTTNLYLTTAPIITYRPRFPF